MPEPRAPKFIPPKDRGRPPEQLDPAYWEKMLAETADPEIPTMAHAEEELGVHYGAEGAEEVEFDVLDPDDRTAESIAKAIASEPGNRLHSFPRSQEDLEASLTNLVRGVDRKRRGEVRVGVHNSCVTGDACVYVRMPETTGKGYQTLHLSTLEMDEPINMDRLADRVENFLNITFKPPE